jgi:outer membrane receptor protein involved in Fe transport
VTPQFFVSPDLQLYARVASGYRIGGPNLENGATGTGPYQGIPAQYNPDKTINYEIGIKGTIGRYFSFDAAAYIYVRRL